MRILHIAPDLSPRSGGPPAVVAGLTRGLIERGVDVAIITADDGTRGDIIDLPPGAAVQRFGCGWLRGIWPHHSPALACGLQELGPVCDLIHIHELWHHPHYAAYRFARSRGVPYVVTVHGGLDAWALRYKYVKKLVYSILAQRRMLNGARVVHAITEDERHQIRRFGVTSPIVVIPNGLYLEDFCSLPDSGEFERDHAALAGKLVVLFLSRLHVKKGLDILVESFGEIAEVREDVHLVVAGPDDGYGPTVARMVEGMGIGDRVTFTGMLRGRGKLAALSRADVFVLPSYSEGFSVAILEAMACGLPVIISGQCHFAEVERTGAGMVIDPLVKELTNAMARLLDDAVMRRSMGERGANLVMADFSWEDVAAQMIGVYQRVLKEGSGTR